MSTCSPCIPHLLLRSISMILFGPPLRRMQLKRLIMNIIQGPMLLFYPTEMMIDDESLPPPTNSTLSLGRIPIYRRLKKKSSCRMQK